MAAMRKTLATVAFVLALILSGTTGLLSVNFATAIGDHQYLPELTIKGDGSVTGRQVPPPHEEFQAPEFINRTGNVYTLTADVEGYSVRIECNNTVFDGAGHTIHASAGFDNAGLQLIGVANVTIKNLKVSGDYSTNIQVASTNCTIENVKTEGAIYLTINSGFNTITESIVKKLDVKGGNNFISKCTISRIRLTDWTGSNLFTQNNFLFDNSTDEFVIFTANFWDDGSVGNYWRDYLTKNPGASEIGSSGIWDTPYVIDANNADNHPLMAPVKVSSSSETEPFPVLPVAAFSVAIVAVVGVVLLVYFKKRKH